MCRCDRYTDVYCPHCGGVFVSRPKKKDMDEHQIGAEVEILLGPHSQMSDGQKAQRLTELTGQKYTCVDGELQHPPEVDAMA